MISKGRKQRIIEIFQDSNINVTDVIYSQWNDLGTIDVAVRFEPRLLAKFFKLKTPKSKTKKLATQVYETTLELDGHFRLLLKFDDFIPIKIGHIKQSGLLFDLHIPYEEEMPYEQKMEIVWKKILERVKLDITIIEKAKKDIANTKS